jgi:hypothetical protein
MSIRRVELDEQEWQQVMAILSTGSWRDANPLLMKIGQQLQAQQTQFGKRIDADGKEVSHE